MSYSNDQWRAAITTLLTMTSKNEISWEPSELYDGDAWTSVDGALESQIGDKLYLIAKVRTKYFLDEEQYTWNLGYEFLIYQNAGFGVYKKIATSPDLSSLSGLFEAAENNMAFARKALDGLI